MQDISDQISSQAECYNSATNIERGAYKFTNFKINMMKSSSVITDTAFAIVQADDIVDD